MRVWRVLWPVVILLALRLDFARAQAPSIDGAWVDRGRDAVVVIAPCSDAPARRCGRVTWVSPKVVHGAEALGVTVFRNLSEAPGGVWRGEVFDPETGGVYAGALNLDRAGRLRVRSCLGALCETEVWSRAQR